MKQWISRLMVLAASVVMLAGCITMQSGTTINSDGSGINEMRIGFTREMMEFMGEEDPFADLKQQAEELPSGGRVQVEEWEDETYQGIKVSAEFTDLEMLDRQLKKLMGPESAEDGDDSFFESVGVRQEGDVVIINAVMQMEGTGEGEVPPGMLEDLKLLWSVEMPTIISYTEEQIATREGNRITWDFPVTAAEDTTYNIEVRGRLDGASTPAETPVPAQPTPTPAPAPAPGDTQDMCFPDVPGIDNCMSGRIRQYWEQNGGLTVFGYPITPQQEETIEGTTLQVQWFERNRLELHPENEPPYDVLLGRLGVDLLEQQGRDWRNFEKSEGPQDGCVYFEDTGHNVCGDILEAWRADGLELDGQPGYIQGENLALFGLPISGVVTEQLSDGNEYQVQWFERARFELHPENDPPYHVLIGLLGNEIRGN